MSTSQKDFYRILGVTDNAEMAVVKAAYKALMMIYHPDRYDGDREEAIKKTKEINEAYTVLIDPDKRRHYTKSQFGFKASYEQVTEPEQTNTSSEKSNDLESGWLIAVELVEGLDELYQNLNILSKDLSFSFKQEILQSKQFSDAKSIAEQLETEFIEKFFGKNQDIQNFSRWLLSNEKRDAAKEINKIVAQSAGHLVASEVIRNIIIKHQISGYEIPVSTEKKTAYKVGDRLPDEGIVFYVDTTGFHGLAASQEDLSAQTTWHDAKNRSGKNHHDWRLPTRTELEMLYTKKDLIGGFSNQLYWSGTESDSFNAWFQNFYMGEQFTGNKNLTHRVRTVRAF